MFVCCGGVISNDGLLLLLLFVLVGDGLVFGVVVAQLLPLPMLQLLALLVLVLLLLLMLFDGGIVCAVIFTE